jgi:hypothetical protein
MRAVVNRVLRAAALALAISAGALGAQSLTPRLTDGLIVGQPIAAVSLPSATGRSLVFMQAVPRLSVGQTFQLTVGEFTNWRRGVAPADSLTWTSTDPKIVAVSSTGLMTGVSQGRAVIEATNRRAAVRIRVTVVPRDRETRVVRLEVTPESDSMEVGAQRQLQWTAWAPDGAVVPGVTPTFRSTDSSIANVSADGMLRATAFGSTNVAASVTGVSQEVRVTVRDSRVLRATLSPENISVTAGDSVELTATGTTRDGRAVEPSRLTLAAGRGRISGRWYVAPLADGPDTVSVSAGSSVLVTQALVVAPRPGQLPTFAMPVLPAATVNTQMPVVTGRTIRVPAGNAAALQSALETAVGGDEIVLPNGAEYIGSFRLPRRTSGGVVLIRSEVVSTPRGTRVTPAAASSFATITTPDVFPALVADTGTVGWRIVGLRFRIGATAQDNYGIVVLGRSGETSEAQLVKNIVLDRVLITAGDRSTSRCLSMNGNVLAVIDSWLADCHAKGRDSQGILGWNGAGPMLIQNNHIEGAGQNIMFGGADPTIRDLTPSDITIRRNHLFKPLSWGGGKWTVKAAFELKHARRVLFEENVIENHWIDAQVGFAILLQAVSQYGTAPWSKVWDITIRNNVIRNSTSGINILSRMTYENVRPTDPTRRVLLQNNLFVDVGSDPITGASGGALTQLLGDHEDVTLVQNTLLRKATGTPAFAVLFAGEANKRLTVVNNVFDASQYGLFGSGASEGLVALNTFTSGARVLGNAMVGRVESLYPAGNSFPNALVDSNFENKSADNFGLRSSLPFAFSSNARVGVNGAQLAAILRSVTAP